MGGSPCSGRDDEETELSLPSHAVSRVHRAMSATIASFETACASSKLVTFTIEPHGKGSQAPLDPPLWKYFIQKFSHGGGIKIEQVRHRQGVQQGRGGGKF